MTMKQKLQNFLTSSEFIRRGNRDIKSFYDKHKRRHRLNKPAVENITGKAWYVNGKLHRLDGPAVEWNASIELNCWYIEGNEIEKERYPKKVEEYLLNLKHKENK